MIEFKPEDIHISLYNAKGYKGSWDTYNKDNGVTIIHLPTGTKVSVERHKSQHKNRNEALVILKDLLTPIQEGNLVFNGDDVVRVNSVKDAYSTCTVKTKDGEIRHMGLSKISHTPQGYMYKNVKALKEQLSILEEGYYNDRDIIMEQIKELEEL